MTAMRSLFDFSTGELTGLRMQASDAMLALNTPPGHAWIDGEHDPRRVRVQLVTDDQGQQHPVAVPRTPERPADSAWVTWAWSEAAGDWVSSPTLAMLQAQARPPVLQLLAELDAKLARPLGEIAEAQALGQPLPAAAVARLQAINADKQALRSHLQAIAATSTVEALQALTTPILES